MKDLYRSQISDLFVDCVHIYVVVQMLMMMMMMMSDTLQVGAIV